MLIAWLWPEDGLRWMRLKLYPFARMLTRLVKRLLGIQTLFGFSMRQIKRIPQVFIMPMVVDNIFRSNPIFEHLRGNR